MKVQSGHVGRASRRKGAAVAVGLAGVVVATVGFASGASASSHREAPLTAGTPQTDNTDVYAFTSPDAPKTVTMIANWIPFEEPNGGPNFYPWKAGSHYDINIDNNGDGKADLTYRWTFTDHDNRGTSTFLYNNGPVKSLSDPHLLFKQTYSLQELKHGVVSRTLIKNASVAPSDVGPASMPNYAALRSQAVTSVAGGGKSFAGQADDPFFLDLRIFDLLYGANLKESGQDTLSGYNVNSVALQLPKSALALHGNSSRNPVIGVWSSTESQSMQLSPGKQTANGKYVQVSRLGNPLVNEVIVPAGLKDAFNSLTPDKDHTMPAVVQRVKDPEVPKLIQSIYGIKAPKTPRNDLVEIFLSGISKNSGGPIKADLNSQLLNKDVKPKAFVPAEELRLNITVPPSAQPNRLGLLAGDTQGFPNGRRLTDDVVDIELQALEGAAMTGKLVKPLAAGDGVNANDVSFSSSFPYLALPHDTAVNARTAGATMPQGGVATGAGGTAGMNGAPALPISTGLGAVVLLAAGGFTLRRRQRSSANHAGE